MDFPEIEIAKKLDSNKKRLFIGAYGFEDRTLGWPNYQKSQKDILNSALLFKYNPTKGPLSNPNKTNGLRKALKSIGVKNNLKEIIYDWQTPQSVENKIEDFLNSKLKDYDEIIVDISSMTKFLILLCLCKLMPYHGLIRIIYSEADNYSPLLEEYIKSQEDMAFLARFPSQGVRAIARARCLSSIRMQGQPITLITFTSFNEQLVRHLLGTMNPHRLIFINGTPPRVDFSWRIQATQNVHKRLIETYASDNQLDENGYLIRSVSTLNYKETIKMIESIYYEFGSFERIICGATGSKMQTVGLFFAKMLNPDIHIEYPTPDSYYVEGLSTGIRKIHEIAINFINYNQKSNFIT